MDGMETAQRRGGRGHSTRIKGQIAATAASSISNDPWWWSHEASSILGYRSSSCLQPRPIGNSPVHVVKNVSLANFLEEIFRHRRSLAQDLRAVLAPMRRPLRQPLPSLSATVFTSSSPSHGNTKKHHADLWNTQFQTLLEFQRRHGHCNVPNTWTEDRSLAHWVRRQRHQYKVKVTGRHSTLIQERQDKLEAVGFIWDPHISIWEERFQELVQFHRIHGHCKVPRWHEIPSKSTPVSASETGRMKGKSAASISKRNAAASCQFHYPHVSAKSQSKSATKCDPLGAVAVGVPGAITTSSTSPLAIWVKCQRRYYQSYKLGMQTVLSTERFNRLNSLGFLWSIWTTTKERK